MSQSPTDRLLFPALGSLPLDIDFLDGRLLSDGGLPWLADADDLLQGVLRVAPGPQWVAWRLPARQGTGEGYVSPPPGSSLYRRSPASG
jgi:hypothetical protein